MNRKTHQVSWVVSHDLYWENKHDVQANKDYGRNDESTSNLLWDKHIFLQESILQNIFQEILTIKFKLWWRFGATLSNVKERRQKFRVHVRIKVTKISVAN